MPLERKLSVNAVCLTVHSIDVRAFDFEYNVRRGLKSMNEENEEKKERER